VYSLAQWINEKLNQHHCLYINTSINYNHKHGTWERQHSSTGVTNKQTLQDKVANKITVDVFGVHDSYTFSVNHPNDSPCMHPAQPSLLSHTVALVF